MKQRLKNWLLKTVIRVVIPSDVISETRGQLYLGGEKVSEEVLRSLQSEAKALGSMRLWSILNETTKKAAFEKGWTTSKTMEELNTAKTMYYVLDYQESIINIIKKKVT